MKKSCGNDSFRVSEYVRATVDCRHVGYCHCFYCAREAQRKGSDHEIRRHVLQFPRNPIRQTTCRTTAVQGKQESIKRVKQKKKQPFNAVA